MWHRKSFHVNSVSSYLMEVSLSIKWNRESWEGKREWVRKATKLPNLSKLNLLVQWVGNVLCCLSRAIWGANTSKMCFHFSFSAHKCNNLCCNDVTQSLNFIVMTLSGDGKKHRFCAWFVLWCVWGGRNAFSVEHFSCSAYELRMPQAHRLAY